MTERIRPSDSKRLFRFTTRSRDDVRSDVEEEFAFHIDCRVDDLMSRGLTEAAAREQTLREFGDRRRGTAACTTTGATVERQKSIARLGSELRQDAKFGARLVARSPAFSMVAILTLALAIGGNTAIFSIVNALALKELPVTRPEQIVRVYTGQSLTSWPNYLDFAERRDVFSDLTARSNTALSLAIGELSARMVGETTSSNYLTMLGVPAQLGRVYAANDTRTDVVVLGERAWRLRFASDPAIVGKTILLGGKPIEVVGVMPRGFRGARPPGFVADFWRPVDPVAAGRTLLERDNTSFELNGRLQPGVTVSQAQAAMQVTARQTLAQYPKLGPRFGATEVFALSGIASFRGLTGTLAPLFAFVGVMTIVAGLVLLVGCANIAGLLLGRGAARRREIGVRLALGASRGRLIRQLLTESLVLALLGGAAGTVLAVWLTGTFGALLSNLPAPVDLDLALDRRMLVYALLLSAVTAVLCGLAPARRATRLALIPALKDDDQTPQRQRLRAWLIAGQVGLSFALILWGGLFARSMSQAQHLDVGFDPSGVVLAHLQLDSESIRSGTAVTLLDELQLRTRILPGVESQGLAKIVPLALSGREETSMRSSTDAGSEPQRRVLINRVSPGWFQTLRIPVLSGRDFSAADVPGSQRVMIVNETAARQFWNGDALGKRLNDAEIVGIVKDSKYWTLGEIIRPTVYTAYPQRVESTVELFVRTSDMAGTMKALRAEIRRLDPGMIIEVRPMKEDVGAAFVPTRIGAIATTAFGALGALLATMGIYGLVAFSVSQRQREIGVRKAIGATTSDIVRLMARATTKPVAAGLLGGLVIGLLGARGLSSFIVGVSAYDPPTIVAAMALILMVTGAASAIPALRAAKVDALKAMKLE